MARAYLKWLLLRGPAPLLKYFADSVIFHFTEMLNNSSCIPARDAQIYFGRYLTYLLIIIWFVWTKSLRDPNHKQPRYAHATIYHYPKFTGLFSGQYGPLQDDCPVNLDNQKFMARVNMQHKCKIMSYHEIYRIFVLQKIVVHFVRLNQYVVAPHRETPAVGNNIA